MRNHRLLTITGAMAVSLLSGLLPAIAAPDLTYSGASTYKDAKNNIYRITDVVQELVYSGVDVTKAPYSDACGFTSLKLNSGSSSFPASITFNGTSDILASIPTVTEKTPYKCTNGVVKWNGTAQTGIFKTSVDNANGSLTTKTIYYPPARTGGASKQGLMVYTATLTKTIQPNACGFILTPGYANSQKKTSGTLSISGSPVNIASLPINPNPPDCIGGKTLTGSATAVATFGGASLYRTTKNMYFTGLTPNSINVVGYDALTSKSFSTTSTCGTVRISYPIKTPPTSIKVGASTYTTATMSLTPGSTLACTNPGFAALTTDRLYKVDAITYVYKTSDLTLKKLVAEVPTTLSKNISVNACGFAVIPALNTANGFTSGDKVTINGSTPYSVTTLPLAPNAPTCKNGVTYLVSP